MQILYIFFTALLFLDCVFLVLLVLLQLPKKEAGAGLAFGAAATDALFGAGSGNVLTKITKYVAGGFFGLALILAILSAHINNVSPTSEFIKALGTGASGSIPIPAQNPLTPSSSPSP